MKKMLGIFRMLLWLALALSAAALAWSAREAFAIGREQSIAYAGRLAREWGSAALLAALYAAASFALTRRRSAAWLLADLAAAAAAFVKAFAVLVTVLSAASFRAATLGNLNSLRSAVANYRTDHNGRLPGALTELPGTYLDSIPRARLWLYHPDSAAVTCGTKPDDAGGWLYDNSAGDADYGRVSINCSHSDWKGEPWNSF
jgi:hypothetical protein